MGEKKEMENNNFRTISLSKAEPPCKKDCKDRCAVPNCHITCKKYLKFKEELEELKKKERLENNFTQYEIERRVKIARVMRERR